MDNISLFTMFRLLLQFSLILCSTSVLTESPGNLKFFPESNDWKTAYQYCINNGSILADIDSVNCNILSKNARTGWVGKYVRLSDTIVVQGCYSYNGSNLDNNGTLLDCLRECKLKRRDFFGYTTGKCFCNINDSLIQESPDQCLDQSLLNGHLLVYYIQRKRNTDNSYCKRAKTETIVGNTIQRVIFDMTEMDPDIKLYFCENRTDTLSTFTIPVEASVIDSNGISDMENLELLSCKQISCDGNKVNVSYQNCSNKAGFFCRQLDGTTTSATVTTTTGRNNPTNLSGNTPDYHELLAMIQNETISRENLEKKQDKLEIIISELQNELSQRNKTDNASNEIIKVVNCSCKADYKTLESEITSVRNKVNQASNSLLPILNEIASLKQRFDIERETWENVTDQLRGRLQDSEAKISVLLSANENLTKGPDQNEALSLRGALHQLNTTLIDLLNGTDNRKLEDKVDSIVKEAMLRDMKISVLQNNITFGFDHIEILASKVNKSNHDLSDKVSKLTPVIKYYNKINEGSINALRTDLHRLENRTKFNLTDNIHNVVSQFKIDLQNLQEGHNKSISAILNNIESIQRDANDTKSKGREKLENFTERCFQNISNVERHFEAKTHSLSNELISLKNDSNTFEIQINKDLHNATITCLNKISTVESEVVKKLNDKHGQEAKHLENEINRLGESLNQTKSNVSLNMNMLYDKCLQNITETAQEFQKNLNAITLLHNASISNVLKEIETNITKSRQPCCKNFNETLNAMKEKFDNEIQSERKKRNESRLLISQLENNLENFKHNVTEARQVSILTNRNILAIQTNLNNRFAKLEKMQNISRQTLSNKVDELQNMTNVLSDNMTQNRKDVLSQCLMNISTIQHNVVSTFNSLSDKYNYTTRRLKAFEQSIKNRDRSLNMSLNQISTLSLTSITRLENEHITSLNRLENLHNTSMRNLTNTIALFSQKVDTFNPYIATFGKQIANINKNISDVDTELRKELSKITGTYQENIKSFITGFGTLTGRLDSLAANLSHVIQDKESKTRNIAMTTCSGVAKSYHGGSTIPFPNIKTHYGISNLASFNSTGIFVCEIPGLYLVTAHVMSHSKGAEYKIVKNDIELIRVQVTPYHNTSDTHNYHTGTGISVVKLSFNDTISVQVLKRVSEMYVYGAESCLSLARLK